jgi:hypothetical protein
MRVDYDKDQLSYALANALKERDEAREAFVIATDQMVIAQGKVREANKERDEAREDAMRWERIALREASKLGEIICGKVIEK